MSEVSRRSFLARSAAVGAGLAGLRAVDLRAAEPLVPGTPNADKLGWRVGFSLYSFRTVTLFEALDKTSATGLRYAELFAWQKFSPAHPDAKPDAGLSPALRRDLKKKAADSGVKMLAIYSQLAEPEAIKATFAFAADMELEVIVGEPPEAAFDTIEDLTGQYGIDFALHNHPQPSQYWNPETGLAALEGRSERMGFCCDTGHWCRSGLDPVEMLKKVAPRVKTFHFKDLDRFGVKEAHDVIWGQGAGRIGDLMAAVKRVGIKNPYFGIEWERDPNEPLETHAKSVAFFEEVAGRLAGA
jgi:sugar phosphate isomerase/epimerase